METLNVTIEPVEGRTYTTSMTARGHSVTADEPRDKEGDDLGPTPLELAMMALGACTSITLEMYARRKGWALEGVAVDITREVVETPGGKRNRVERRIRLDGDLDEESRARLMDIAARCPVAKLMSGDTEIVDVEAPPA